MRFDHRDEGKRCAVSRRPLRSRRPRVGSESGQATTEFALILLPLLALIGGIIYFGIGLNYWLDMNKVANQGARWAAVNNWPPYCLRTDDPLPPNAPGEGLGCDTTTPTTSCATVLGNHSRARLQDVLRCQTRNPSVQPVMCYPGVLVSGDQQRGDPVKIKLTAPYKFWFVQSVRITLTASATMRLEQEPSVIGNLPASC